MKMISPDSCAPVLQDLYPWLLIHSSFCKLTARRRKFIHPPEYHRCQVSGGEKEDVKDGLEVNEDPVPTEKQSLQQEIEIDSSDDDDISGETKEVKKETPDEKARRAKRLQLQFSAGAHCKDMIKGLKSAVGCEICGEKNPYRLDIVSVTKGGLLGVPFSIICPRFIRKMKKSSVFYVEGRNKKRARRVIEERAKKLDRYKEIRGCCADCGLSVSVNPLSAFEFDHVDPTSKIGRSSNASSRYNR